MQTALTPALSPREREFKLPLPRGEGWGEGFSRAILFFLFLTPSVNLQASCWSDTDLAQHLSRSEQQPQLLYIWSDRAPYAVQQLPVAQRVAGQAGLQFTAISEQELCSETLRTREALRHFPSAFVLAQGKIHPHPIVGAMPEAAWQMSIAQRVLR